MKLPTLDQKVKEQLNALTESERKKSRAYIHDILCYGVRAVAHVYVVRKAQEARRKRIAAQEFAAKQGLIIGPTENIFRPGTYLEGLTDIRLPLQSLEDGGIFLPAYRNRRDLTLFDSDNMNLYDSYWYDFHPKSTYYQYAWNLVKKRDWSAADLFDLTILETGLQFGQDLWELSLHAYKINRISWKTDKRKLDRPEPAKVARLVPKLIDYYAQIVNAK